MLPEAHCTKAFSELAPGTWDLLDSDPDGPKNKVLDNFSESQISVGAWGVFSCSSEASQCGMHRHNVDPAKKHQQHFVSR